MTKLLVEEPDALMRARPGLWEPWGGNDPGPPGPRLVGGRMTQTANGHIRTHDVFLPRLFEYGTERGYNTFQYLITFY